MRSQKLLLLTFVATSAVVAWQRAAVAEERGDRSERPASPAPSVAEQAPRVALTHTAFAGQARGVGAIGYVKARQNPAQDSSPWLGGSILVWGNPIERLTLMGEGKRRDNGEFAPAAGAQFRFLGGTRDHYALGALAQYVAEGFAELEGEIEAGLLASYARHQLHLDANLIVGAGFEEDEADGELLARFGYDVLRPLRLGAEGRLRQRLAGEEELPGGSSWDAVLGGQAIFTSGPFLAAVTAGPSMTGTSDGVGWLAFASVGGATF